MCVLDSISWVPITITPSFFNFNLQRLRNSIGFSKCSITLKQAITSKSDSFKFSKEHDSKLIGSYFVLPYSKNAIKLK